MQTLAESLIPLIILSIIFCGLLKKIPVFDSFISGAKEGLETVIQIFPSILGLIVAITMFKNSGALEILSSLLAPVFQVFGINKEIIPLIIMRPISGSGSLIMLQDTIASYGPDSEAGRIASVIMSSTETTIYVIALYFSSINIKNTRYALKSSVIADIVGILAGIYTVKYFF